MFDFLFWPWVCGLGGSILLFQILDLNFVEKKPSLLDFAFCSGELSERKPLLT